MKILNKVLNGEEKQIGKKNYNDFRCVKLFCFSMLGNWEAAYKDFCKAQLSDFDEDVQTWCKEVEANVCLSFSVIFSCRCDMSFVL